MKYSGDPRWIRARFASICANEKCGQPIKPGEQVFYYPRGKKALCKDCSQAAAAEFAAAAADEALLGG